MATLSTAGLLPAAGEVAPQALPRRDHWSPAQARLGAGVAVTRLLPVGVPELAVEAERQLAARPDRVSLPRPAERVAHEAGNVERHERFDLAFVQTQELPAR